MVFSEGSRIKIPCILHLPRPGYRYLFLKNAVWDEESNIRETNAALVPLMLERVFPEST